VATWTGWESELLGALGEHATRPRIRFLRAWAACEGGTARFNPLNTTLYLSGSTAYNRAGVRNYDDAIMGLAATLLTIRLGYYSGIRAALRATDITAAQIALRSRSGIRTWGTNPDCVIRRLQG